MSLGSQSIVTRLPLEQLWRDDGFTSSSRGEPLGLEGITALLRIGAVSFVVVDVGLAPRWIPLKECFDFWKRDGRSNLVQPHAKVLLDKFLSGHFYRAYRWTAENQSEPIIVLEKYH